MKLILISIIFLTTSLSGQVSTIQQSRQTYSADTKTILNQLDSLLKINQTLEFRTIGESNRISEKFLLYGKLVKTASEKELLDILNNPKELSAVRGYAYMAYAFKCNKDNKKEKNLNYDFKLNTLKGCIGHNDLPFSGFKKEIRIRNAYDPNPRRIVIDPEEKKVIKEEKKLQAEPD